MTHIDLKEGGMFMSKCIKIEHIRDLEHLCTLAVPAIPLNKEITCHIKTIKERAKG